MPDDVTRIIKKPLNRDSTERSDFAEQGCQCCVPIAADLRRARAGMAPTFLVRALRDTDGASLDRVQTIKGWLNAAGKTHEKVYDVAWPGTRKPGKDGKLPQVGNTVNVKEPATPTPSAHPTAARTGKTRPSTPSSAPATTWAMRRKSLTVIRRSGSWRDFSACGVRPALARLHIAARCERTPKPRNLPRRWRGAP